MKKKLLKISTVSLLGFLLVGLVSSVYAIWIHSELSEAGTAKFRIYAFTESYSSEQHLAAVVDTSIYMDGDLYDNPKDSKFVYDGSGEALAHIDEIYSNVWGGHFIESYTEHKTYEGEYFDLTETYYTEDSLSVMW